MTDIDKFIQVRAVFLYNGFTLKNNTCPDILQKKSAEILRWWKSK